MIECTTCGPTLIEIIIGIAIGLFIAWGIMRPEDDNS